MKSFILMFMFLMTSIAFGAISNANNPHTICYPLGSLSSDTTVYLSGTGAKSWEVTSVEVINAAAVAASDTDYLKLSLKKGATEVAELDTRAAHESGLALGSIEKLNLVSAEKIVPQETVLSMVYDETDSGTAVALSSASACIHYIAK